MLFVSNLQPSLYNNIQLKWCVAVLPYIKCVLFYFLEDPLSLVIDDEVNLNFSKYLEKQRVLQPSYILKHSKQSEMLVSLLQYADSRRYNIPITQMPGTEFIL